MNNYDYWSVERIVKSGKYPFTTSQLRHFLLYRHKNGLEIATRKVGKRLYFRMDLFENWLESYTKSKLG